MLYPIGWFGTIHQTLTLWGDSIKFLSMADARLHIQALGRAISSLEAGLLVTPYNDVVRNGLLHRFEFTFELCWKSIRSTLLLLGRDVVSSSPKPLFRDALQEGWIMTTHD